MSTFPWLPEIIRVVPWTEETYDHLYDVFLRDIKYFPLKYQGQNVWFFKEMEDGREVLFWHLTSREDRDIGGRLPDMRRCERLVWVRPSIENAHLPPVLCWDYVEGDKTIKTYIWLKEEDFVIILKKYRDETRRLVTSFYVDYPSKRRNLEMKYRCRI